MRARTLLAGISLALAASTTWLALELKSSREDLAELRSTRTPSAAPSAAPATAAATRHPDVQATPVSLDPPPAQAAPAKDPMQAQSDAAQRAATLAHNVWVKSWLGDPEKRAKTLADARRTHEREFPRQLLDMSDEDHDRLLDLLAASDMRYAEALYRCNTDAACDVQDVIGTQMQANKRDLVALIGEDKAQRLEDYRDNYMERNSVDTFRSGLPESMGMTDGQAERLADALGEERRRIVKEWQQRGESYSGMANAWGSLNFPQTQDVERRVAEATEFQRRQRDRAAEILTSAQLERFTKQQEQMLEIARGSWE